MLNKKKILVVIMLFFLFINISSIIVFADVEDEEEFDSNELQEIIETSVKPNEEPRINSKAAIIFDRTTKKVMWGKNENDKRAMASTTKIMTAIVVLENSNLTDVVTISKKAAGTGGSRLKIKAGDKITVNDLLYGLMLKSGNDAAVALAQHVGGSVEGFAELMNKKALELGLTNSHFVTPHGLDSKEHYTTAYELALLTDYALSNPKFASVVKTKTYNISINGTTRTISNTNELLGNLYGVDGVKTGFTGNAMRCLVTSCSRDGHQIITVVLGADTKKDRTIDSKKLIEYAFSNFERVNIEEIVLKEFEEWKLINKDRININKAKDINLELTMKEIKNKIIPLKRGEQKDIKIIINCIYEYEAPVNKGIKVGNVIIKNKNEIIETVDIVTGSEIKKKDIWFYFKELIGNFSVCLDF